MDKKDMRIVFMGTPEFAVESLKALVEGGYNVVGVVTQPDKPVGRHQETLQPPAVKVYAESVGLPVLQPIKMKDAEFLEQLRALNADLQVVVAFRMLPEVVWSMPRFGTFNVHAALLPQYRGAAPINWAVINGETETGVTTFFLDKDIDTGRIIKRKYFPIPDSANVEYVYDGLMRLGAELAIETIDLLCEKVADDFDADKILSVMNEITEAQDESSDLRHAPKIFKETCEINWHQEAITIYNFVRGLSPYPGAWSKMVSLDDAAAPATKMVLKIFEVAKTEKAVIAEPGTFTVENKKVYVNTNDFLLELKELQLSGKKRMDSRSFLNGFKQVEEYRLEKE
ncbi:MAG: methionyl-tRNA formyltransferase [Prevotella nigrescens]|jgi:methionyl-tRNA formyltransferase|uniref:methionyl-tRNA formyltransferase n=1 Tax=Prevotella nigrescens TaxID=28133 RepID=UPI0002184298|nr:methionyl-tRNA formyltransferase [Prevotella nigrescens]EGQ17414.1 methionyl-tRNA formyltransferase [Prevotella nigrescens ATCC 33563]UAK29129.1 methionyl-tRNA formyltransferase [Prevotella nigrescens]WMS21741.1 methionyl-tRNA formyltransferase [Prevotella nigrescens]